MRKTNDSYCVVFQGDRIVERYYRDKSGWLKVSNRGRRFRMTAEQVLNHILPALAFGDTLRLTVAVERASGLSLLLIAITSGISMIPAFSAWTASPAPGCRTRTTVAAIETTR